MNEQVVQRSYDVYLVGVGGQGLLTIAELLSEAALAAGMPVAYYPSKGMAQRGGFVKAQVRLGRAEAGSNIPERGADLAIALERSEALKAVRFVRPGGEFVLYDDVWAPAAVVLGKASYPTAADVCGQITSAGVQLHYASPAGLPQYEGKPVSDNIFVLGLAVGGTGLADRLDREQVAEALRQRWPKAGERNLYAFAAGLAAAASTERLPL